MNAISGKCRHPVKDSDLIEEGLLLVLDVPGNLRRQSSLAGPMKRGQGAIDSGISYLASNPEHLTAFGRDALLIAEDRAAETGRALHADDAPEEVAAMMLTALSKQDDR